MCSAPLEVNLSIVLPTMAMHSGSITSTWNWSEVLILRRWALKVSTSICLSMNLRAGIRIGSEAMRSMAAGISES